LRTFGASGIHSNIFYIALPGYAFDCRTVGALGFLSNIFLIALTGYAFDWRTVGACNIQKLPV
jgi:hypothetical protein